MKLSRPKQVTWSIALALAILALLVHSSTIIAILYPYSFWLALISAVLLLVGTSVKGL